MNGARSFASCEMNLPGGQALAERNFSGIYFLKKEKLI